MKYYEITIISTRYDIAPTKFVDWIGNNMNQTELKESIESSFRNAIPEGRIKVTSTRQIGISDYLKCNNANMVYAGFVVCKKIKEAKQMKWRNLFAKILGINLKAA